MRQQCLQSCSGIDFTVLLTEDKNGFYIKGKKFAINSAPMLRARVGSMQHSRVVNETGEVHPFHIHQVHFLAHAVNGVLSEMPEWLILSMCPTAARLLSHEDKGTRAKIVFE
jgi:suppressor of ftsI